VETKGVGEHSKKEGVQEGNNKNKNKSKN